VGVLGELQNRRRARRWQRWTETETEPEADYTRRAGIGAAIGAVFLFGVFVMIVVGLVFLR
jgi:hypothetical protein